MKRTTNFKKMQWLFGLMTLAMVAAACGSNNNTEASSEPAANSNASDKETLYIGLTNAPGALNPINATDASAQYITRMLYPTLLDQPEELTFEGNLATDFETKDNQTYTISLREDAVWSDDEPITAEDVAYTLNLIANPKVETVFGAQISTLEGVEESGKFVEGATEISGVSVVDEHTLTLKTKVPVDPNYVKEAIGFGVRIVPKHIVEKENLSDLASSSFVTQPTVSGSLYKFVKYEQDSYVQLEVNPSYYKGEPKLKNVYLRVLSGTNLVTELQSGGIDMAAGSGIGVIPVSEVDSLKKNDNLVIEGYPGATIQFMYINNEKFDKDVRLAMTYAINRQALVDQLFRGEAETVNTIYLNQTPYFDKSIKEIPYDVEKAKELLADSGFDLTQEIELTVPTGHKAREQSANLIQQNLEAAGFKVKQVSFDFVTALTNVRKGDYDLGFIGIPMSSDPDQSYLWTPNGSSNFGHVDDEQLTKLFEEGKAGVSMEERLPIYGELQEYFRDNAFAVGLYSDYQYKAQAKNLTGGVKPYWAGSLYDMQEWTKK